VIAKADARAIVFGHIGAGNLHVNVLGPAPDDDSVDDAVFRLAAEHGGTISAEHGIGRAKAAVLHLSRSAAEIAAMRAVKSAFDPAGLLNPGVLFLPPGGRPPGDPPQRGDFPSPLSAPWPPLRGDFPFLIPPGVTTRHGTMVA